MIVLVLIVSGVLGCLPLLFLKDKNIIDSPVFRGLLLFSGSLLLGMVVTHLIPELFSIQSVDVKWIALSLLFGLLFQMILENWTKGLEHGHSVHGKVAVWSLIVGLSIHSALETVPIHFTPKLVWGVAIHKAAISIVLFVLVNQIIRGNIQKVLALGIFISSAPLGFWLGHDFAEKWLIFGFAFSVGMMTHVAQSIIFEFSKNHQFNTQKIILLLSGFLLALLF